MVCKVLENPTKIVINESEFAKFKTQEEKREHAKNVTRISISKTRIENIKLFFDFGINATIPKTIEVCAFNEAMNGFHCITIYTNTLPLETIEKGTRKRLTEVHIGNSGGRSAFWVHHICFMVTPEDKDYTFTVDVIKKWTYLVRSHILDDEFYLENGALVYDISQNFAYPRNPRIEITVMEKNEDEGVLFCGAMGFSK